MKLHAVDAHRPFVAVNVCEPNMSGPCRASDAFSLHHPLRHPRQLITLTSRRQAEGQQVPSVLSRLHSALLVGSGSGSGSGQRCTFRSNIPYMAAGRP